MALSKDVSYVENEIRIVMIGKTGSGKSSTCNTVLGKKVFKSRACAMSVTKESMARPTQHKGRDILVIDTPGLFDPTIPNEKMKKQIMKCVAMASPGLHAVILVTQVNRFTEEEKNTVEEFKRYFGEGLSNYLIIIFTGKDNLKEDNITLTEYINESPPVLKELVNECNYRCLTVDNRAGDEEKEAFRDELVALIDSTVEANGGNCYTNVILEAAEVVMKEREREIQAELEEKTKKEREEIIKQQRQIHEQKIKDIESAAQIKQKEQEKEMEERRRAFERKIKEMQEQEKIKEDLAREELKRTQDELKRQAEDELKKEAEIRAQLEKESDEEKEKLNRQLQESHQRAEALERKQKEEKEMARQVEQERLIAEKEREEKIKREYQRELKEDEERRREEAENRAREKIRLEEEQKQKERESQEQHERQLKKQARLKARQEVEEERSFLGKCGDAVTDAASATFDWVRSWF